MPPLSLGPWAACGLTGRKCIVRPASPGNTGLALAVEADPCKIKPGFQKNQTLTHIKGSEKFLYNLAA